MLRCSICSRIYQNGTQQFCTNDGGKLLQTQAATRPFKRTALTKKSLSFASDLATTKLEPLDQNIINAFEALPTTPLELPQDWRKQQELSKAPAAISLESAIVNRENSFFEQSPTSQFALPRVSYVRNRPSNFQSRRSLIAAGLFAALLIMIGVTFAGAYFLREQKLLENSNSVLATAAAASDPRDKAINDNYQNLSASFVKFRNSKNNLSASSNKNFVEFSIVYPNHWQQSSDQTLLAVSDSFLNLISFNSEKLPAQQVSIDSYESRGTFATDSVNFPVLAENLSAKYAARLSIYKRVSEGFTTINNRAAYEFRFEGQKIDQNQKTTQVWGRTIFLPVEKQMAKGGLTITILATPLVADLSGVKDVGEKSELSQILKTIEFEN